MSVSNDMDDEYSKTDQGCILLAFYFGKIKVINNIALIRITNDLLHAFKERPDNNTTKYEKHVETCCLCHEKENIYKTLLAQYYHLTYGKDSGEEENNAFLKDIDNAWTEVKTLWDDAGLLHHGKNDVDITPIPGFDFTTESQTLLQKHGIHFLNEDGFDFVGRNRRWRCLLMTIKNQLTEIMATIEFMNGKELSSVPGPSHTRRVLRNIYLGLLVKKSARTHARYLQDIRHNGVQIRAAKDPIAVVAKYIMCCQCLVPRDQIKLIMVTEIIRKCIAECDTNAMLDGAPDVGERLGRKSRSGRALKKPSAVLQKVFQDNDEQAVSVNEKVLVQPAVTSSSGVRRSDRTHAIKKKREGFVYYANGLGPHSDEGAKRCKPRRASFPAAVQHNTLTPPEPLSIKIKKEPESSSDADNFSVVILTSENSSSTLLKPQLLTTRTPPSVHMPTVSSVGRPRMATLIKPSGPPFSTIAKTNSKTFNEKSFLNDKLKQKIIFVPSQSGAMEQNKTPLIPVKISPITTPIVRGRSFSLDSAPTQKVVFRPLKPKSAEASDIKQLVEKPGPKKPFLVQIVDGKICKAVPPSGRACMIKKQPQKLFRTIPISSNQVKFMKSVSLHNSQGTIGKPLRNVGKMISVRKIRPTVGVTPRTLVMGNLDQRRIMRIGPLKVAPHPQKQFGIGSSFTFKTNASHLLRRLTTQTPPSNQGGVTSNSNILVTGLPVLDPVPNPTPALKPPKLTPNYSNSPNKTPGKRRNVKFPSKSMSTVVAEYIFSLMPSADDFLWKKVQDRNKRRGEKTSRQIPIPYETNFLCIYDTIEKQGWKAYWYRKCRCSKIRKREAEEMFNDEHEQNPTDLEKWIPKSVTEVMKETLTLSIEMDDKALSLGVPKEKLTPVTLRVDDDDDTADDIIGTALDFDEDVSLDNADADEYRPTGSGFGQKKRKCSEEPTKKATLSLKAKYRKDKDGNWTAMSENTPELTTLEAVPVKRHRRKKLAKKPEASTSEDSVMLNIRSGVNLAKNSTISMEDTVGMTQDHGLRRCARATMIRRKALVKRATESQLKSKAKREKAESMAAETYLFNSFRDGSFSVPNFEVVSIHPACFRDDQEQYVHISSIQDNKIKIAKEVCKNHGPKLEVTRKDTDGSLLTFLAHTPTSELLPNRRKFFRKKAPELKLKKPLDPVENLSQASPGSSKASFVATIKDAGGYRKKRFVVNQIKPGDFFSNLQVLRGILASSPQSNVISKENAEYVVSAVQVSNFGGGFNAANGSESVKVSPSTSPTKSSTQSLESQDLITQWLQDVVRGNKEVDDSETTSKPDGSTNFTKIKNDLPKNLSMPSSEGDNTKSSMSDTVEDDLDIDIEALTPDKISPITEKEDISCSSTNSECHTSNDIDIQRGGQNFFHKTVLAQLHSFGLRPSLPSFEKIFQDLTTLSKFSLKNDFENITPVSDFSYNLDKYFDDFEFPKRLKSSKILEEYLAPKYNLKRILELEDNHSKSFEPRNGFKNENFDVADFWLTSEVSDVSELLPATSGVENVAHEALSDSSSMDDMGATVLSDRKDETPSKSTLVLSEKHITNSSGDLEKSSPSSSKLSRKRKREPHNALDGMYWSKLLDADGREPKHVGIYLRRRHVNAGDTDVNDTVPVNKRKKPGFNPLSTSNNEAIVNADRTSLKRFNEDILLDVEGEDDGEHSRDVLFSLLSSSLDVDRVKSWMLNSTTPKPFELLTPQKLAIKPTPARRLKRRHSVDVSTAREALMDEGSSPIAKTKDKRCHSDGDQPQKERSLERKSRDILPVPVLNNAYVRLMRCPTPEVQSSPPEEPKSAKTTPGGSPSRHSFQFLIKFASDDGKCYSRRPIGVSKSRSTRFKRQLDFEEYNISKREPQSDDAFDDVTLEEGRWKYETGPGTKLSTDNRSDTLERPVRSCRVKNKLCLPKVNHESPTKTKSVPPKLKSGKHSIAMQALREVVFAELKKTRDNEPSTSTERRRPLLQSKCSTKGSFIRRLLESDAIE